MANKKFRNLLIIVIAAIVAVGIAVALILVLPKVTPGNAEASGESSGASETVTSEESQSIGTTDKNEESLKEGEFVDKAPDEQKQNEKGELGGSETLEIIKPENSSEEATSSTESKTEWIEGIW